jgi:hypothetical protein
MPVNLPEQLSLQDVIRSGGGKNLGGLFGFGDEYGKYFQDFGEYSKTPMERINQSYGNAYRDISQGGQKSFMDMATQARSGMGQSGFAGGGMFQKALMSGSQAINQAQQQGFGDARFSRQSGIQDMQGSYYDKAMQTALRLLESGAESGESTTGSESGESTTGSDEPQIGDAKYGAGPNGETLFWDGTNWVTQDAYLRSIGRDPNHNDGGVASDDPTENENWGLPDETIDQNLEPATPVGTRKKMNGEWYVWDGNRWVLEFSRY